VYPVLLVMAAPRPHLPRHPTTRELTEWPSLINPHSSRPLVVCRLLSAAVGVDQAGPLGELARRGVPREVRPSAQSRSRRRCARTASLVCLGVRAIDKVRRIATAFAWCSVQSNDGPARDSQRGL